MLFGFGISVLFCHTKVDNMDNIGSFGTWSSYQKIVWFDVSIDEILFVDGLDTGQLELD